MTVGVLVEQKNNWDLARATQIEKAFKDYRIESEICVDGLTEHQHLIVFGYSYSTFLKIAQAFEEDRTVYRYIGHSTDDSKSVRLVEAGNILCRAGFTSRIIDEWSSQRLSLFTTGDPLVDYCTKSEAYQRKNEFGDYILLAVDDIENFSDYLLGHVKNHNWKLVDSSKPKEVVEHLSECRAVVTDNFNVADASSLFRKRTLLVESRGFYQEPLVKHGGLARPIGDPKPVIDSMINSPSIVDSPFLIGDGSAALRIASLLQEEVK